MVFSLLLSLLFAQPVPQATGTLIIEVENIQTPRGTLRIGVFNQPEGFPDDDYVYQGYTFPVLKKGTQRIEIKDLPFGEYAIAFHHDLDETGKMETNFFGVPREPYAFSSGAIAKWRAPQFSEADFMFSASGTTIDATLHFWEDF